MTDETLEEKENPQQELGPLREKDFAKLDEFLKEHRPMDILQTVSIEEEKRRKALAVKEQDASPHIEEAKKKVVAVLKGIGIQAPQKEVSEVSSKEVSSMRNQKVRMEKKLQAKIQLLEAEISKQQEVLERQRSAMEELENLAQQKTSDYQRKITQKNAEIRRIRTQMAEDGTEIENLQGQVGQFEKLHAKAKAKWEKDMHKLSGELSESQGNLKQLEDENKILKKDLRKFKKGFEKESEESSELSLVKEKYATGYKNLQKCKDYLGKYYSFLEKEKTEKAQANLDKAQEIFSTLPREFRRLYEGFVHIYEQRRAIFTKAHETHKDAALILEKARTKELSLQEEAEATKLELANLTQENSDLRKRLKLEVADVTKRLELAIKNQKGSAIALNHQLQQKNNELDLLEEKFSAVSGELRGEISHLQNEVEIQKKERARLEAELKDEIDLKNGEIKIFQNENRHLKKEMEDLAARSQKHVDVVNEKLLSVEKKHLASIEKKDELITTLRTEKKYLSDSLALERTKLNANKRIKALEKNLKGAERKLEDSAKAIQLLHEKNELQSLSFIKEKEKHAKQVLQEARKERGAGKKLLTQLAGALNKAYYYLLQEKEKKSERYFSKVKELAEKLPEDFFKDFEFLQSYAQQSFDHAVFYKGEITRVKKEFDEKEIEVGKEIDRLKKYYEKEKQKIQARETKAHQLIAELEKRLAENKVAIDDQARESMSNEKTINSLHKRNLELSEKLERLNSDWEAKWVKRKEKFENLLSDDQLRIEENNARWEKKLASREEVFQRALRAKEQQLQDLEAQFGHAREKITKLENSVHKIGQGLNQQLTEKEEMVLQLQGEVHRLTSELKTLEEHYSKELKVEKGALEKSNVSLLTNYQKLEKKYEEAVEENQALVQDREKFGLTIKSDILAQVNRKKEEEVKKSQKARAFIHEAFGWLDQGNVRKAAKSIKKATKSISTLDEASKIEFTTLLNLFEARLAEKQDFVEEQQSLESKHAMEISLYEKEIHGLSTDLAEKDSLLKKYEAMLEKAKDHSNATLKKASVSQHELEQELETRRKEAELVKLDLLKQRANYEAQLQKQQAKVDSMEQTMVALKEKAELARKVQQTKQNEFGQRRDDLEGEMRALQKEFARLSKKYETLVTQKEKLETTLEGQRTKEIALHTKVMEYKNKVQALRGRKNNKEKSPIKTKVSRKAGEKVEKKRYRASRKKKSKKPAPKEPKAKTASVVKKPHVTKKTEKLFVQCQNLIQESFDYLHIGENDKAQRVYRKANRIYHKLPEVFQHKIYNQIVRLQGN